MIEFKNVLDKAVEESGINANGMVKVVFYMLAFATGIIGFITGFIKGFFRIK